MIVTNPVGLFLLPLALLPLISGYLAQQPLPTLAELPRDPLSTAVDWLLRIIGVCAIAGLTLGISGAALPQQTIEQVGKGAHIALLIDRSSSMDNTFAGRTPAGGEESKSQAAKRLLRDFIAAREHDSFGVGAFSTSPIPVLPMTDHKEAVLAAVEAIDRPGLAFTDIGRGLALALDIVGKDTSPAEKVVLVVSDGAAVIERRIQERLRAEFIRQPLKLYWLYLRSEGSPGINEQPPPGTEDTPRVLPERHLNKFFQSLKIPYRAYEAESPQAVQLAIAEISKLEQRQIIFPEHVPRRDLSSWFYAAATLCIALLLGAAELNRRLAAGRGGTA